jgi:hypothetical protein
LGFVAEKVTDNDQGALPCFCLAECNIFPRAGVVLCSNKYLSKCLRLFLLSIVDSSSGATVTGANTLTAGQIDYGSKRSVVALAKQTPLLCSASQKPTVMHLFSETRR